MKNEDVSLYTRDMDKYLNFALSRPDYQAFLTEFDRTIRHLSVGEAINTVEFCSGPGHITKRVSELLKVDKATLIDINQGFLSIARDIGIRSNRLEMICDNILEVELKRENNIVLSPFAYHHIPDNQKSLYIQKAKQTLIPGGFVILGEIYLPDKKSEKEYYAHVQKLTRHELKTQEYLKFLKETAESKHSEFKVSKQHADKEWAGHGFKLMDEKRVWSEDLPKDHGMYIQVYNHKE